MKKRIPFITIFLLLGTILSACSSGTSNALSGGGTDEDESHSITYAQTSKIVGLSPIMTNDSVSSHVIDQIYETLFVRDPKTGKIKPGLATSYENPDQKTWMIHLRKGVKFQDGTPFNAEAVKYTFDKLRDPKTAAPRASLLAAVDKVQVKDEHTVVIKTKKPYGPLLAALCHTNASIVSPTADQKQNLMKKPVGTGPFKLKKWVAGDHVELVKNKNYWKGSPKLDKVTFKVVPNIDTAVSMLQIGQVDFIDNIPVSQWERVKHLKHVQTKRQKSTQIYYLGFNMKRKPMNNLAFRKAVSYAIDRDAYVDQLYGLGIRSNSFIGPEVSGYDKSAEKYGYNYHPKKAKEIIKKHGWQGTKINMLVANREEYMKMGQIVQDMLKKVGLDVHMETMEWGTFLDVSKQGKYDITFLGWANSTADGSELLYPNLGSDNKGSTNIVFYDNPKFDRLVAASRFTVNQQKREEKLDEANKMAIKDAPWVVMNHSIVTLAYRDRVKGLVASPTDQWFLSNVHKEQGDGR